MGIHWPLIARYGRMRSFKQFLEDPDHGHKEKYQEKDHDLQAQKQCTLAGRKNGEEGDVNNEPDPG